MQANLQPMRLTKANREVYDFIMSLQSKFQEAMVAAGNEKHIGFSEEAHAFFQLFTDTSKRFNLATKVSLVSSFLSIAKSGLSIVPQRQLAYITLDETVQPPEARFEIKYRGFLQTAARSGLVKLVAPAVIYENDEFEYQGEDQKAIHKIKSLSIRDRGLLNGGYCTTTFFDGSVLTTVMTREELEAIEKEAKEKPDSFWHGPYVDELRRKTLIRRHWKSLNFAIENMKQCHAVRNVNSIIEEENTLPNNVHKIGQAY